MFVGDEGGYDGDSKHEQEAHRGQVKQIHVLAVCQILKGNPCVKGDLLHGILEDIDIFLQSIQGECAKLSYSWKRRILLCLLLLED